MRRGIAAGTIWGLAALVVSVLLAVAGGTASAPPTDDQTCASNLAAIARAFRTYAIDYDGRFPMADYARYDIFGNSIGRCDYAEGLHWTSFLQPYVPRCSVFLCPKGLPANASPILDNYGWNYDGLSPRYAPAGLAGIATPAETMVAMDAHSFCFVFGGADTRERFLEQVGVGSDDTPSPARHDGKMNVAYVDGHVGSMPPQELEGLVPTKGVFCPFLGYPME